MHDLESEHLVGSENFQRFHLLPTEIHYVMHYIICLNQINGH